MKTGSLEVPVFLSFRRVRAVEGQQPRLMASKLQVCKGLGHLGSGISQKPCANFRHLTELRDTRGEGGSGLGLESQPFR